MQSVHWRRVLIERRVRSELGSILGEIEFDSLDADPLDILAEQMARSNAMVTALGVLVGELPFAGFALDEENGETVVREGLYGPDHNGDGRAHVLVAMYGDWLDRAGRLAKLAKDAGLEERRVALDEEMAALVQQTIEAALERQLAMVEQGIAVGEIRKQKASLVSGALEATAREIAS